MKITFKILLIVFITNIAIHAVALPSVTDEEQMQEYRANCDFFEQGNIAEALERFRVMATNPSHICAAKAVGALLHYGEAGDRESAIPMLRSMLGSPIKKTVVNAANALLHFGTIWDYSQACEILQRLLKHPDIAVVSEAACSLGYAQRDGDISELLPILRIAVNTPGAEHECIARSAAGLLVSSAIQADRELAISVLLALLDSSDSMTRASAANTLLYSKRVENSLVFSVLREIVKNPVSLGAGLAACELIRSDDIADKELAVNVLLKKADGPAKVLIMVALALEQSDLQAAKDKSRQVRMAIAADSSYLSYYHDITYFWYSGNAEEKDFAHSKLIAIASDLDHQHACDAAIFLLNFDKAEDKEIGRQKLQAIAANLAHPKACTALCTLWQSGTDEYKESTRTSLRAFATGENSSNVCEAICALWNFGNAEDKEIAYSKLKEFVVAYPMHSKMCDAAKILWDDNKAEDRAIVRPFLHAAAANFHHQKIIDIIDLLWLSSDAQDQEVARPALRAVASGKSCVSGLEYWAADRLCGTDSAEDKKVIDIAYKNIILNLKNSENCTVVKKLLESEESRVFALEHIRSVLEKTSGSEELRAEYAALLEQFSTSA